ncbi:MAG TPA: CRTAC1 family protein [Acidimicrobiia bacterium]
MSRDRNVSMDTHHSAPAPSRRTASLLGAGMATGAAITLAVAALAYAWITPAALPPAGEAPRFVEEAAIAGIDHVYDGEFTFFVGGGVAAFDCDGDGLQDLYFAGGANPAGMYRNRSSIGGDLVFEQVVSSATDLVDVTGAYPVDVDSDGQVDLAVLGLGENVLLRGLGDCRFERANELWGIDGGSDWTAAFSASWERGAAWPTLAFGNYLVLDEERRSTGRCADNQLFRPGADGYGAAQPLSPGWCTLSILFYDWDGTGRTDLRMANDRHYYVDGEEQLWRVTPDAPPSLYTIDDGWERVQIWGMGIATHDLTGDGRPEVFLTSQGDNKLQTLAEGAAGPDYTDIAILRGVTAHRPYTGGDVMPSTAWHPEFADVNNDGYVDLFVSKGNVEAMPEFAVDDPSNLLLGRSDGTFVESGLESGIARFTRARGAALVDLNLDGLIDIVEVNRRSPVAVWRNLGPATGRGTAPEANWATIRLRQPAPNVDAVGAWLEVRLDGRSDARQVTVGGGHAGGSLGWIHVGLGSDETAMLRVRWPGGETGPWIEVPANRFSVIERGADVAVEWTPAR